MYRHAAACVQFRNYKQSHYERLRKKLGGSVKSANFELRFLVDHILKPNTKENEICGNNYGFSKRLSPQQLEQVSSLVEMRTEKSMPLQYILGDAPFARIKILCRPPVLIPRWETEEWAANFFDHVLKRIKSLKCPPEIHIFDLFCGSGCIGLYLKSALLGSNFKSTLHSFDICPHALSLTVENYNINFGEHASIPNFNGNGISYKIGEDFFLYHVDLKERFLFEDLSVNIFNSPNRLASKEKAVINLIVSNAPYISESDYLYNVDSDVKQWESKIALTGGMDGLLYYPELLNRITELNKILKSSVEPFSNYILFTANEIGHLQGPEVKNLFSSYFDTVQVWKDMGTKDRCVTAFCENATNT
jgi:release factor glutamine methyltransferase